MNSPPLPTTFAHEGNDKDASETNSSPRPNIETPLEPSGSQAGEKTTKQKNVLETSVSIFDNSLIQAKYANERALDVKFRQEMTERLYSLLLHFDSWSTARPGVEAQARAAGVQKHFDEILERERTQESIRQDFGNFLNMVRSALMVMGNGQL